VTSIIHFTPLINFNIRWWGNNDKKSGKKEGREMGERERERERPDKMNSRRNNCIIILNRLLSYLYKNLSKSQIPLKQRNNTHYIFATRVLISKARVPKIIQKMLPLHQ